MWLLEDGHPGGGQLALQCESISLLFGTSVCVAHVQAQIWPKQVIRLAQGLTSTGLTCC
jgi:hypothetical protein